MEEGLRLFGAPLKTMEMRWVNGKFYRRLVPLVGGGRDLPTPPSFVLWLASRLHPAFRRAEKTARESFAIKRWRSELAHWETEWKPDITRTNAAFTAVVVGALSDDGLADHLTEVYAHLRDTIVLHFRLHVSDMGPLGDLMVHLEDWGLHRDDTFRALVHASPATRGPADQLRKIADALRDAGVDPATVVSVNDVAGASPAAAAALDTYLQANGWKLTTGYEIEDRCLAELPDVVVTSIRAAATADRDDADTDEARDALASLRDQIPVADQATFVEFVEDARLSYGLRDENGPITYEWPAGLLRRALLDSGRRLEAGGNLPAASAVFELAVDEVATMLRGGVGPSREEIERRADERRRWAALDAPSRLGPEEPPPPVSLLPENLARITRIILTLVGSLEADPDAEPLNGTGIGTEPYVGTARVVRDAAEAWGAMEPGDIIVASYTAPTYNAVLAMAGGLVTEEGGLLCHAAVIARELGLPAVIGAPGAMDRIPDGSRIEVDPKQGRVRVLT